MPHLDPLRLDRALSRFAEQRARFLFALRGDEAREHPFEDLPRELTREHASELAELANKDPLGQHFRDWAAFLSTEHATLDALRALTRALRFERHRIDQPERAELSLADLRWQMLVDAPRRAAWVEAYARQASRLAARRSEYWDVRNEAAQRFAPPRLTLAETQPLVAAVLARTDDAFRELELDSLTALIERSLGRRVPGDYPRRLGPRALAELFRDADWLKGLEPRLGTLPEMLGVSSLLRALERFGSALHDAIASRSRPFVLAFEPLGLRRAEIGALFALLPLNAEFAARRFGVARGAMNDYRRALEAIMVLAVRLLAVRTALLQATYDGSDAHRRCFTEWLPEVLGFELSPQLAGAIWADERAPVRFAGLLAALGRARDLVETHDEDWFRNPRAVDELRAELESPPARGFDAARAERGLTLLESELMSRL